MLDYFNELTEPELRRFETFILSPYFRSSKKAQELFIYLKRHYPKIQQSHIDKKKLFSLAYPNDTYNDTRIRKLISEFMLLFEKFLLLTEYEKDKSGSTILLLRILRRRGISKRFEIHLNELKENFKRQVIKDDEYYKNRFNLNIEDYYYNYGKVMFRYPVPLFERSENLDLFFAYSKLHLFHEMFSHQYNAKENLPFQKEYFKEVTAYIRKNEKNIISNHSDLYIIYLTVMMWQHRDSEKYIKKLKNYLNLNEKKIDKERLFYYYSYVLTYYRIKINEGMTKYRKTVFSIYKRLDSLNIITIDKFMHDSDFNTIVNTALSLKEYEWTKVFIDKYKDRINPESSKEAYNLAYAKFYFYKKDFDKSLKYLNEVEYTEFTYYSNSKYFLARVHYELNNVDALRFTLNTLKGYLRRKKLSVLQQSDSNKFLKYFSNLIKVKTGKNYDKNVLKKELDNEKKFVPGKNWFYEKLNEIE